jgi:hypothetical protein
VIVQLGMNLVVGSLRSPRISAWGIRALLVGLLSALLCTAASAEPAAQAVPSAMPTASAAVACVTLPTQGVVLIVASPNPGDVLMPGSNVVIQGVAYDTAATSGVGVDRVSVYLGDRDTGGIFWGNAALGLPNPVANSGQFATAGFSLRSPTIPAGSGGRTIFVYARSSVTNREAIVSVPVFLGAAPTPVRGQVPTPVLTPMPACTPTPTAVPAPTSTPTPFPTFPPIPALPATAVPVAPAPPPAPAPAPPLPTAAPLATARPAPAAVAPAAATTAPRGGGIPAELGVLLLGVGTIVVGGGYALRRRERRGSAPRQ